MSTSSNATRHKGLYHKIFTELADPRTNDWFLITSPLPIATILGAYLIFVLSLGPRLMRNRKPFQLKRTLIVYNFIQVLISIWLFWESLDGAWLGNYSWRCQPIDYTRSPLGMRACRGVYIFFLAKVSELLDTIFFVLRKKDRQITFLHLYHHTIMPTFSWFAVKYLPGGHGIFIGFINSFVHIIMYTYYMLAAMLPEYGRLLWWKKYITDLQLIQFCIAFIHNSQLLFYDCGYPRWTVIITLPNAIFFYYLFARFYNRTYKKKTNSDSKKDDGDQQQQQQQEQQKIAVNSHNHMNGLNGYHTKPNNHIKSN